MPNTTNTSKVPPCGRASDKLIWAVAFVSQAISALCVVALKSLRRKINGGGTGKQCKMRIGEKPAEDRLLNILVNLVVVNDQLY